MNSSTNNRQKPKSLLAPLVVLIIEGSDAGEREGRGRGRRGWGSRGMGRSCIVKRSGRNEQMVGTG
jgi:hypothetical protein